MDLITSLLDSLDDISKLVPSLDAILRSVETWISVFLLIGPVMLLGLGIWYLVLPPKEANHRAGFRTYFGMGSVEAWRFTQKIAGMVWGVLGLVLTIVMGIICLNLQGTEVMQMIDKAITCLFWQIGLAAVSYVGICVVSIIFFDSKGNRRK